MRFTFGYYRVVQLMLENICYRLRDEHLSLLDVGCLDTRVAQMGDFDERYTVDIAHDPKLPRVQSFIADFLSWEPPHRMTVVTCLQVLEHLSDAQVSTFARKLLTTADYAIVSVPFMWPEGAEAGHQQDPISLEKFFGWMGRLPDYHIIVYDQRHHRVVGLWFNVP
jgi:hypothetical protein